MNNKRRTYQFVILLVIILLIIHILLLIIKVPTHIKVNQMQQIPYNDTEFYFVQESTSVLDCQDIDFNWEYSWQGWKEEINNAITPILSLKNLDNESGDFIVYFAFFDNQIYDYEQYQGSNYNEVRNKLPWDAASMFSNKKTVNLAPNQEILIDIYTEKFQSTAQYWTYADITVPYRNICSEIKDYTNVTKTRSVTKYTMQNVTIDKRTKISLLMYLYNLLTY